MSRKYDDIHDNTGIGSHPIPCYLSPQHYKVWLEFAKGAIYLAAYWRYVIHRFALLGGSIKSIICEIEQIIMSHRIYLIAITF